MTDFIGIVILVGVGADLFSLSLLYCVIMLAIGFRAPPESLAWLSSGWAIGAASVAVVTEVLLDTQFDRRKRFARSVWPKLQHALSAMVTIVVVLALSDGKGTGEITALLATGLVATGIIKHGAVEKFRQLFDQVTSILPGSHTTRQAATLASVPLRAGAAAGLVVLGYQLPYVALALLIAIVALGLAGLVVGWLVWKAFRIRARTECPVCDYRPLKVARICPKCHSPTVVAASRRVKVEAQPALIEALAAVAWSDGAIAEQELAYLQGVIQASDLLDDRKASLRSRVQQRLDPNDLDLSLLEKRDGELIASATAAMLVTDGEVLETEQAVYDQLCGRLGIDQLKARQLLLQHRRMAWG